MSLVDSIIDTAKTYIGTTEGSQSHQEIIDLYNRGRYSDAYKMTMQDPWCCAFVVACFVQCGAGDIIPGYAACDQMINIFKKWGNWNQRSAAFSPQKGDVIFYDWNGDGSSDHVGLVVQTGFGELSVIEGNKSDSVSYRKIATGASQIIGYGRPNYSASDGGGSSVDYTVGAIDREYIKTLPLLQSGSNGVYVKILQVLLNYYHGTNLDVDGEFGSRTKTAVLAYQRAWELEQDGVVGRETWTHILVKHPDRTDK